MKFKLDPAGIEGYEQGVVFFKEDGSEGVFISTNLSPHRDEPLTIQQILLCVHMKRAAWKVHDGLVPDEECVTKLNALRKPSGLLHVEPLKDGSIDILARLVQSAISLVEQQRRANAHKLSLPPYDRLLLLLQQLQSIIEMGERDPHEQWLAALNADITAQIRAMPKEQIFRATDIDCPYQPRVWVMLGTMSHGYDDVRTLQVYDGYVLVPYRDGTYRWYSKERWIRLLTEE